MLLCCHACTRYLGFDPSLFGDLHELGAFQELGKLIDSSMQLDDIIEYYREVSGVYDNKLMALPMTGLAPLMYYRRYLVHYECTMRPAMFVCVCMLLVMDVLT